MNSNTIHAITLTYLGYPPTGPTVTIVRRYGLGALLLAVRSEIRTMIGQLADPSTLDLAVALDEIDGPPTLRSGVAR